MPSEDTKSRGQRLLAEALRQEEITDADGTSGIPILFGGKGVYWEKVDGQIQIVIDSRSMGEGRLRASVSLTGVAANIAIYFPNDEDAIAALRDALSKVL